MHTGPEMLAKRYDLNVIFESKKKRGYYEAT
jgi:KDO2-lipid IV(A) lauroyltransferase